MESSDKLNELFADGNEFTLHRLLSDMGANDLNIDMNDLVKFDPLKVLDARSISEFVSRKIYSFFSLSSEEISKGKKQDILLARHYLVFSLSVTMRFIGSNQCNR